MRITVLCVLTIVGAVILAILAIRSMSSKRPNESQPIRN